MKLIETITEEEQEIMEPNENAVQMNLNGSDISLTWPIDRSPSLGALNKTKVHRYKNGKLRWTKESETIIRAEITWKDENNNIVGVWKQLWKTAFNTPKRSIR